MTTRLLRLLAALLTLALFAAACGDDATPSTDAAGPADGEAADDADPADDGHDHDAEHDPDAEHDHDGDAGHGDHDTSQMSDDEHDHADHHHGGVEFEGADAPTVAVEVTADPAGGVNVFVETTNFTVAAQSASTDHVEGEGHFHLYVDGEKVMRFYNRAVYFGGVTEGDVDVMVELSANDHSTYTLGGEPIAASTTFSVPAHSHDDHSHAEPEPVTFEGALPQLDVVVEADPKSGYNAFISIDGMTLSAENASGAHVPGEGHLHIYVNDQKLGRLYGPATHIPVLPDGEVEIRVAAYTNDHMVYVDAGGAPIEATTSIEVR